MAHGEQLARIARKFSDRPAFTCAGTERTFAEVDARVSRLASALAERGLGHGDRLAVLMGNSIEMVEAIFAGWRLGAIVVPVNFRLVADEVRFVLADSTSSAIVVDEHLAPLVAANRAELPELVTVVVVGDRADAGGPSAERYDEVLASGDESQPGAVVGESDPALICYTSGTTGRPKGAVLTHFNLVMSTLNSMIIQGITGSDDVWYGNLPLFHIGGLSGILPYVIGGGRSVIVPSGNFDAGQAVKELSGEGVTGCVFVGMQWNEICDQIAAQQPPLRLRRVSWGAANTPVHVR